MKRANSRARFKSNGSHGRPVRITGITWGTVTLRLSATLSIMHKALMLAHQNTIAYVGFQCEPGEIEILDIMLVIYLPEEVFDRLDGTAYFDVDARVEAQGQVGRVRHHH